MDDFSPDEKNLALSQGLLGLGAGLLSGSFGHYGAFGPALGAGISGFQTANQNFTTNMLHQKMFKQQKEVQDAQIRNYNSEAQKRQSDMDEQKRQRDNAQAADNFANGTPAPQQQSYGVLAAQNGAPPASNFVPAQQPQPTGNGDYSVGQTDVTTKPVSNLLDPNWHLKRAEYLYKQGDRKGAEEAAKRANELRAESFKQDEADNKPPATKLVPNDDGKTEQMFEWDKKGAKWKSIGGARPIFSPTSLVSINDKQETAAGQKMGQIDAETVGEYQKSARAANNLLPVLKRMEMNVGSTYSGATADFATGIGNIAVTLGVATPDTAKKVASSEQALSDVANLIREKIKALGSGTAISNTDLLFTKQSMPDLLKTPSGRKMIIKAMRADLENVVGDHKSAREWFDSHGKSLAGFEPPSASSEPVSFDAPSMLPDGWSVREK